MVNETTGKSKKLVGVKEIGCPDGLGNKPNLLQSHITLSEHYIVANNIEIPRIMDEEIGDLGYIPLNFNWYKPIEQSSFARMIKGKRIGTDSLRVSGADMIPITALLSTVRSILDADQIEQYRWLAVQTSEILEQVLRIIELGWTEQEIRGEVAREALRRTINPMIVSVMTDERIYKYRH